MKIILSPYLSPCQGRGRLVPVIAGLLLCSACSTVRHAPVVDRAAAEAEAVVEAPGQPVEDLVAEPDAGDDAGAAWVELPQPEDLEPQGEIRETEAPLLPDRVSDNPAVLALMDETDYRLGEGDAEAAASSVERALRLEPKNPWLWHRLAVLRLQQGHWRQAAALAEKSNSLSLRHPELRKANAGLIERAGKQTE
ncbi:MAG: tetratricopeptide repeat protein [Gammaproteobacteria bacterium]|nr:tetratricopeptide repeat protein [Gammaproteobacteria bacterium]